MKFDGIKIHRFLPNTRYYEQMSRAGILLITVCSVRNVIGERTSRKARITRWEYNDSPGAEVAALSAKIRSSSSDGGQVLFVNNAAAYFVISMYACERGAYLVHRSRAVSTLVVLG